jgi:hypothetical protein
VILPGCDWLRLGCFAVRAARVAGSGLAAGLLCGGKPGSLRRSVAGVLRSGLWGFRVVDGASWRVGGWLCVCAAGRWGLFSDRWDFALQLASEPMTNFLSFIFWDNEHIFTRCRMFRRIKRYYKIIDFFAKIEPGVAKLDEF